MKCRSVKFREVMQRVKKSQVKKRTENQLQMSMKFYLQGILPQTDECKTSRWTGTHA